MVAVVSGAGLGLFGSSISALGGAGAAGSSGVGRGTDRVFVNSATGNLIVQSQDEHLSALGLDLSLIRTYNSQGLMNDDNGDNWRLGVHQRVYGLTGTLNTAGSTIVKTFGDGREVLYTYDTGQSRYVSTEGDGAHDTLSNSAGSWTWTDGSGRNTETYNSGGQLTQSRDVDGNTVSYAYVAGLLTQITDASGQTTYLDYSGNNLTQIRVDSNSQTQTLTRYTYDSSDRLTQVQVDLSPQDNSIADNQVYTTTYTYEGTSRRIATITQSDGSSVAFTYQLIDGEYRVRTYTDGESRVTTLTYSQASASGSGPVSESANGSVLSTSQTQPYNLNAGTLTTPSPWSAASLLESSGTGASDPKLAFDADGNGFAVWAQGGDVLVRRYTAATDTWAAAEVLDARSETVYAPALAVDSAGNATVAWVQSDGTASSIYARSFSATGGTWNTATVLESSSQPVEITVGSVAVAMRAGYAAVAWLQSNGTSSDLYASVLDTGNWYGPDLVENNVNPAAQPSIAIDADINMSLLWRQSDGTVNSIYANRYSNSTWVWGTPVLLEGSGTAAGDPQLVFDANGDGLAIWNQGGDLYARRYTRSTDSWSSAVTLDARSESVYAPSLSVDEATGDAIAAWVQSDGTANSVYVSRYTASTNAWSTATVLESSSQPVSSSTGSVVASLRGGYAAVAWLQSDGTVDNLYAARFNGTSWSSAQSLEGGANAAAAPSVAIDVQGNVSVLWQQSDGTAASIYQARYSVSGVGSPYYVVPAGATWQSLANTLYGVNSAAAGAALQSALGNPSLMTGLALTGLPATLSVTTTVPAYYTVQSGDTWASITQTIYGTNDTNAIAELQAALSNPTLSTGLRLTVPPTVTYDSGSGGGGSTLYLQTQVQDALGLTTTYTQDAAGRLTAVVSPTVNGAGLETRYAYDTDGNVTSITEDPSGLNRVTTLSYDLSGNLLTTRDSLGNTVTRTYSSTNQVLTETQYLGRDPDGAGSSPATVPLTTRYVYDTENHLRFVISADGRVTEHRYAGYTTADNRDGLRSTTLQYTAAAYTAAPFVEADLIAWSAAQDLTQLTRVDYGYDFRGNVSTLTRYAATNVSGAGTGTASVTQFVYDQRGQLLQTLDARGSSTTPDPTVANTAYATTYIYDGLGRVLTTTQWNSGSSLSTTLTAYDDANRQTVTTLANGLTTTRAFNRAGELISLINGSAGALSALGTTSYAYDAGGRLRIVTDASGVRQFYLYDEAGRNSAQVDGDGTLTEFIYDRASELIKTVQYATRVDATTLSSLVDGAGTPTGVTLATLRAAADDAPAQDRISRSVYNAAGQRIYAIDEVGAVTQFFYDGAGRITDELRYANPVSITRSIDQVLEGSFTITTSADDRHTRHFYDADGKLTGTLDAAQYLVEYRYDAAGRLIEQIGYANQVTSGTWLTDTLAQLRTSAGTDEETAADSERDHRSYFFYDGQNRKIGVLDGEGYLTETAYDVAGQVSQVARYDRALTYSAGVSTFQSLRMAASAAPAVTVHTTSYQYDGAGRLTQETNYQGTVTAYAYDSAGQLTGTTRAQGTVEARTTETRYDFLGRITQELTAEGRAQLSGSLSQAQIDDIWDRYGIRYAYDLAGRKISATQRPNDTQTNTTLYYYDNDGRVRFEVNAAGERTEYRYNALNQRTDAIRYYNRITTTGLTGGLLTTALNSTLTASADATRDARTSSTYTLTGRVEQTRVSTDTNAANDTATTLSYNAFGEVRQRVEQIDATDGTRTLQHDYAYDRRGQLTSTVWDPAGVNTSEARQYDAFGRISELTDARGYPSWVEYDRLGRTIATIDTLGAVRETTYDAFSRVMTTRDALNNVTTYTYDDATRTVTMTTPEGINVATIHNRHGQTLTVSASGNTTNYSYDLNGQLQGMSDSLGSLEGRTYDRAGRQLTTTDARGTVTRFTYDAVNRVLTRTVDSASGGLALTTSYVYDGEGRVQDVTEPNGRLTRTSYDRSGRVTQVAVDPNGLNLRTSYTYDRQGHVVTVTEGAGSANPRVTQYTYDALGRRTQEIVDPSDLALTTDYEYDANGNLTFKDDPEGNRTYYVHDEKNRLNFIVDATGGVTRNEYDANDRIISTRRYAESIGTDLSQFDPIDSGLVGSLVTQGLTDRVEQYVYDGDGREVFKIDAMGGVVRKQYDDLGNVTRQVMFSERVTAGTYVTVEQVEDALALVNDSDVTNDRESRTIYDQRGQARYTIDALGGVVRLGYDASGNLISQTAFATPIAGGTTPTLAAVDGWAANASESADRTTRTWYDAANRVRFIQDAEGYVREKRYDDAGRVTSEILYADPPTVGGNATTADVADAVLAVVDLDRDQRTDTLYDAAGRVSRVTDARLAYESFTYDAVGNRLTFINKKGATWNYAYDANRRLIEERSPTVEITTVVQTGVIEWGIDYTDLVSTTASDVIVTRMQYDALGNVVSRTEATERSNERTTYYVYDALGRQTGIWYPSVDVYDRSRDELWVDSVEDRAEFETQGLLESRVVYDALGNAVGNFDVGGAFTQKIYDELGRVRYVIDAERYVTEHRYDTFGNQVELIRYSSQVDPQEAAYAYGDPIDADALTEDMLGSDTDRVVTTDYDRLNRAVRVTQPQTSVFLPSVGQPGGQLLLNAAATTVNEYNAQGQLIRQSQLVDPISGLSANTYTYYDERGQMSARVDALGYLTTYEYDAAGNLTRSIEYARPLASGSWNIDGYGTPTSTTPGTSLNDPAGYDREIEWEYDQLNRRIAERRVGVVHSQLSGSTVNTVPPSDLVSSFGYDAVGNQTRVTDANGASTYTYYDALGRQIATAAPARDRGDGSLLTPLTRMRRDAFGNLVEHTVYSLGATNVSEASFSVTATSSDQTTMILVDSMNRAIETADASGVKRRASYTEGGQLAREWQSVSDDRFERTVNKITVYVYDRLGRQTEAIEPSGEYDYGLSQGAVDKETTYNAFGEIVERVTFTTGEAGEVQAREYFDYDQAGHLWRTNSGGAYKIFLYDLGGRATAEIKSQSVDLENISAEAAAALTSGRMRTETRYDLLGRVEEQRLPQFAPANPDDEVEVIGTEFRVDNNYLGPNNPNAVYRLVSQNYNFGYGSYTFSLPELDPAATVAQGGGYQFVTPTAGNQAAGWTQDTSYQLVPSRYLHWARPAGYGSAYGAQNLAIAFEYRAAGGSGAWTSLSVVALPGGEVGVDIGALPTGAFDYRVTYTRANQLESYAIATGTITIDGANVSTVDTTLATLAADNITPTSISTQISINTEFRDAQFRIGGFSSMNPLDDYVYRRVATGSLVSYVVDRSATLAQGGGYYLTASGYVQDPSYQPENSRYIRWNVPAEADLIPVFEYRWLHSGSGWQSPLVESFGSDEYGVAIGSLSARQYEYRVHYYRIGPEDQVLVATATGIFNIGSAVLANEVVLTPDPSDDAGTVAAIGNRPAGSNAVSTQIVSSGGFDNVSGGGLLFSGTNDVLVKFPSTTGAVRVELEYSTRAVSASDDPGPSGTGWAAVQRRISLLINDASAAASGLNLTWQDPSAPSTGGGISAVTRIRVYSVTSGGEATLRYASDNADAATIGGTALTWDAPWNTAIAATFNVRAAGTTTWQEMAVSRASGDFSVDVQSLGAGAWEYEVIYRQDGVQRARSEGTFVVSGGSIANVFENPGSGPFPVEPVAPVSGIVTSAVEFTVVESATQVATSPSYTTVDGQMRDHRPLGTAWDGENEIALTWADVGSGPVRVTIDYTSAPRYSYNYASSTPARWEETATFVPGARTSRTIDLSSGGATGTTWTWQDDDNGNVGGVQTINRIRVYTQVSGNWVLTYDRDAAAPTGGTSLYWPSPDNSAVDSSFRVREVGTTTWQAVTVGSTPAGLQFADLSSLGAASYEYEIRYSITEGGVTTVTALTTGEFAISAAGGATPRSRTLDVTQNNVAFDRGANDFGPATWDGDQVSWSFAPQSGDSIVFRTRVVGATSWQEQTISGAGPDFTGPATASNSEAVEFEILYTGSGQTVPYARSRGSLNSKVASASVPATIAVAQTATAQTSIAGVANVTNTAGQLSWTTPAQSGSTVTFRYQLANGTWQTLSPTWLGSGFTVPLSQLPSSSYRYEIVYRRTGETLPYAFASGLMAVGNSAGGGTLSLTDTTSYTRTVTQQTDPSVPTMSQVVDRWGNVLSVSDSLGNTINYRYNQQSALIETRLPEVQVVSTAGGTVTTQLERPVTENFYDLLGRLIATRDANGSLNGASYNAGGQILSEMHADGGNKSYIYDAFGNQIRVTDELGYRTQNTYDAANRLTAVQRELSIGGLTLPGESITKRFRYDEAGRRIREDDGTESGTSTGNWTQYRYDLQDNLIARYTPRGYATQYAYDAVGRKISELDANGFEATWSYDVAGRLIGHRDFGGTDTKYEYDNAGLLIRQTSSLGQHLTYSYDEAGHLVRITDTGTASAESDVVSSNRITEYGYDLAGRRITEKTIVDGRILQDSHITFDARGRMSRAQDPDYVVNYSYDAAGNRTRINSSYSNHQGYGGGNLQTQDLWYTYDAMNRVLVSQGVNASGVIGISAGQGAELGYNLKGERTSERSYAEHIAIDRTAINGVVSSTQYRKQTSYFTERYGYDGMGRMVWTEQEAPTTTEDLITGPTTSITSVRVNTRYYDGASRETLDEVFSIEGTGPTMALTQATRATSYNSDGLMTLQENRKNGIMQFVVRYGNATFVAEQVVPVTSPAVDNYVRSYSTSGSNGVPGRSLRRLAIQVQSSASGVPTGYVRIPAHWTGTGFDRAGVLRSYKVEVHRPSDGKYQYATDYELKYRLGETYQLIGERTHSYTTVHKVGLPGDGSTTRTYNVNGELVQFSDSKDANKSRHFLNDAQGQMLMAVQGNFDGLGGRLNVNQALDNAVARTGNQVKAQHFFSVNGQAVGSFGQLTGDGGSFKANFDVNYTPISDSYPASVPSQVIVQSGDTLRSIAARVFGDASLWYLIAEENGLSNPDSALEAGAQLRIPNDVVSLPNSSSSFKPFDVGAAIGDTTPAQPAPPRKKRGVLDSLLRIVVIVVAILVTVYTAGVISAGVSSSLSSIMGAGFNAVTGAAGAGGIGAAAVGGAVGSAASQGAAIALGIQESFDWKGVAMGAVGAGVTAGLGASAPWGRILEAAGLAGPSLNAVAATALTQGISVLTGLQEQFSWQNVALAAMSAPVAKLAGDRVGALTDSRFALHAAAGISGSLVRAAVGGKIDEVSILVDAFGNALGNSIVDRMSPRPVAGAQAGSGPVEELQEVGIAARYVGPGSEERNARLDNNPINVIRSGSDGMQSSSEVLTMGPGGPEEIVVAAQRLTVPQERLYDRLIAPIWQLGYGMPESAAMSYADRARENDIRYDNDVTAENNRIAINLGLAMVGGGAAGALGAALFPTFLAGSGSVLQAGAASGLVSDIAFQGYQNALFAGSGGDYGRSGIDGTELALSAGLGALPGLPAAVRGWADDLRGLGVPDWSIRLAPPGTLYTGGIGLELERIIGQTVSQLRRTPGVVTASGELNSASGTWLDASVPAPVPRQVADALMGKEFSSFDDLRSAVWEHIGKNPELSSGFTPRNVQLMQDGYAPLAPRQYLNESGAFGKSFNLHHIDPVANGGAVYDLSNLQIVSPKAHYDIHY